MADETKVVEKPIEKKYFKTQVLHDTDPQGSEAEMRASGMDMEKYGCCGSVRMARGIPQNERTRGCTSYEACTLLKIKGKGRPVNLAFRLFKKGGKIREGYGPCFSTFRMAGQYNGQDPNFVMEIMPQGSKVGMRMSRMEKQGDGTEMWVDDIHEMDVPPFPKMGDSGYLVAEQQSNKVRAEMMSTRRQRMMEATMGITGDEAADEDRTGKSG
jgi:hypothetical protein